MFFDGAFYFRPGRGPTIGLRYAPTQRRAGSTLHLYGRGGGTLTPAGSWPARISAPFVPLRSGGIRARVRGSATPTYEIVADGVLGWCLVESEASPTIAFTQGRTLGLCLVESEASVNTTLVGIASLLCRVRIAANPSAQEIAGAVWSTPGAIAFAEETMGRILQRAQEDARTAAIESQS